MENEKPCTRRENSYCLKNNDIKNCFPIIYNNCPKTYCEWTSKNIEDWKNSTPKIKHETIWNYYKAGRL